MENDYLTEEKLGVFLETYFKEGKWIHNKAFSKQFKIRPDFRNDYYKLIVEFDGYFHYTKAFQILKDKENTKIYVENGFKVIRIPYFVQLSENVIENIFNLKINYEQKFSHGFVDDKCVLPCDFCELGLKRFEDDIENKFKYLKNDIIKTLKAKISERKEKYLVIPPYFEKYFKEN